MSEPWLHAQRHLDAAEEWRDGRDLMTETLFRQAIVDALLGIGWALQGVAMDLRRSERA